MMILYGKGMDPKSPYGKGPYNYGFGFDLSKEAAEQIHRMKRREHYHQMKEAFFKQMNGPNATPDDIVMVESREQPGTFEHCALIG